MLNNKTANVWPWMGKICLLKVNVDDTGHSVILISVMTDIPDLCGLFDFTVWRSLGTFH